MDLQHPIWRPENHNKFREKRLYKQFLNNAMQGLSFSEEVMCEMGPFSSRRHDMSWLFYPTGPLAPATRFNKVRKNRNNDMHCNIHSLTRETGGFSVHALHIFGHYKGYTAIAKTGQIGVHTCHKQSSIEEREAQSRNSRCQEFAHKKFGKTREQGFIDRHIFKDKFSNKSFQLLPLRKQHRYLGSVSSQGSINCLNRTETTLDVRCIEIPQAMQNPCDRGKDNSVEEAKYGLPKHALELNDRRRPEFSRQVTRQLLHCKPVAELSSLYYAVDKWRRIWNIKLSLHIVTTKGLKRALNDPNYSERLEAIMSCAIGAFNGRQQNAEPGKTAQFEKRKEQTVCQELQDLIVAALKDPVKRVQIASAVCLCVITAPNSQAKDILQSTLKQDLSGTGADSWMAAQCLAIHGDISQAVTQRLLSQHFFSDSVSDQEQSLVLLSRISKKTTLVRSLLAEELSNGNWRTRFQACNSITQLRGPINKDLCHKLIHMMWNDWNCDVRKAAAQALSKLDMGTDLQNELSVKLEEGPNALRFEALMIIGQLNIMTPKLMPSFLHCFSDDFVAVRTQACLTAASLMIEDQAVLEQLIKLMQNDPLWEVRVEAINGELQKGCKELMFNIFKLHHILYRESSALGKIGCISPTLQELLMWALHLEDEPSVRIAACKALSTLEAKGPELHNFLQGRYALEPDTEVQRHIEELLKRHGYSPEKDESKIQEIKQQVKLLCTKQSISLKVLRMEEMEQHQQESIILRILKQH